MRRCTGFVVYEPSMVPCLIGGDDFFVIRLFLTINSRIFHAIPRFPGH